MPRSVPAGKPGNATLGAGAPLYFKPTTLGRYMLYSRTRTYLGGATSVRGWGSRRLSPRIEECSPEGDCKTIPVGGYAMVQGNFEARVEIIKKLSLVGFFDMGDVQAETTFDPSLWNYSAGPGLRAETPVGVARLDVGFRLNDPGIYTGEPVWGLYFGLGQAL